jgi:glycosyltransferase involved in cell wall biosynthesis
VDGGSTDGTPSIAARLGTRLIMSERGRGHGLRAGAAAATGEFLLFLHADSVFPQGGLAAIGEILDRNPRVPGGNFRVVFDGDTRFARGLTVFYAWIRRLALYYGDSGIFVRRAVYAALGGFRPMALMEDYEFVRRLERAGPTCRIEDPRVAGDNDTNAVSKFMAALLNVKQCNTLIRETDGYKFYTHMTDRQKQQAKELAEGSFYPQLSVVLQYPREAR